MEIKEIPVYAFSISEKGEERIKEMFRGASSISMSYLPVGIFDVTRKETREKGIIFKKEVIEVERNKFFVDLLSSNLYYIEKKATGMKIMTSDILLNIMNLPIDELSLFAHLVRYGAQKRRTLDQTLLANLEKNGFVIAYEYTGDRFKEILTLIDNELRTFEEPSEIDRFFVKSAVNIPKFLDDRYSLDLYIDVCDVVDDSYPKEKVHISPDLVARFLGHLWIGTAIFRGIAYIPRITGNYDVGGKMVPKTAYPVVKKGNINARKLMEKKLKPISLKTEIDLQDAVPVEMPTITFDDVIALDKAKEYVRDTIIRPLKSPEISKKYGILGGGSLLLYGPPGCGKTYLARAIIGECGLPFFSVKISDLITQDASLAAENLHKIFKLAGDAAPSVIFFDEIDAIGERRDAIPGGGRMMINEFLVEMDGVETAKEKVLILGATNHPWHVDPALRRPGRFDKILFVPPPEFEARVSTFKKYTKNKPLSDDVDFRKLSEMVGEYSFADIKAICDEVIERVWKEEIRKQEEGVKTEEGKMIRMQDFVDVIKSRNSSLAAWFDEAEVEIEKSPEKEIYSDLLEVIKKHKDKSAYKIKEEEIIDEIIKLKGERVLVESEIKKVKTLFLKRNIDEDVFRSLLKKYEEQLIEIESKIDNLKSR